MITLAEKILKITSKYEIGEMSWPEVIELIDVSKELANLVISGNAKKAPVEKVLVNNGTGKKIHKMSRIKSGIFGWQVRPICKVDNRGAYKGSTHWTNVNCENCLNKKEMEK